MLLLKQDCLEGRHVPRRALVRVDPAQGDPNLPHARCCLCGHLLVKSPITRRWRATGMMG